MACQSGKEQSKDELFQNARVVSEQKDKLFQTLQERKKAILLKKEKETLKPTFHSPVIFKPKEENVVSTEKKMMKHLHHRDINFLRQVEKSYLQFSKAGNGGDTKDIVFKLQNPLIDSEKSTKRVRRRQVISKIPSIIAFDDSGFEFLDDDDLIEPDSIKSSLYLLPDTKTKDCCGESVSEVPSENEKRKNKKKRKERKKRGYSRSYKFERGVENEIEKTSLKKPSSLSAESLTEQSSSATSSASLLERKKYMTQSDDIFLAMTDVTPTNSRYRENGRSNLAESSAEWASGFHAHHYNERNVCLRKPKKHSLENEQKKKFKSSLSREKGTSRNFQCNDSDSTLDLSPSLSSYFEKLDLPHPKAYDLKSITSIKNKWDSYRKNEEEFNTKMLEAELEKIKFIVEARKYDNRYKSVFTILASGRASK